MTVKLWATLLSIKRLKREQYPSTKVPIMTKVLQNEGWLIWSREWNRNQVRNRVGKAKSLCARSESMAENPWTSRPFLRWEGAYSITIDETNKRRWFPRITNTENWRGQRWSADLPQKKRLRSTTKSKSNWSQSLTNLKTRRSCEHQNTLLANAKVRRTAYHLTLIYLTKHRERIYSVGRSRQLAVQWKGHLKVKTAHKTRNLWVMNRRRSIRSVPRDAMVIQMNVVNLTTSRVHLNSSPLIPR